MFFILIAESPKYSSKMLYFSRSDKCSANLFDFNGDAGKSVYIAKARFRPSSAFLDYITDSAAAAYSLPILSLSNC